MRELRALGFGLLFCFSTAPAGDISSVRLDEIKNLLFQDCGSCHGMHLTGGLGPSLTRESLLTKTTEDLVLTIQNGVAGTPMPPWKPFLNDDEVHWLVNYLQQGSPS